MSLNRKFLQKSFLRFAVPLFLVFFSIFYHPLHAGNIVIIVNPNSKIGKMDEVTAKRIFLGQKKSVNGVRVNVVDVKDKKIKKEFYEKLADLSLPKLRKYWYRKIFTGKGRPPKSVRNAQAAKRVVGLNKDVITYIDKSLADSNVKIVFELN